MKVILRSNHISVTKCNEVFSSIEEAVEFLNKNTQNNRFFLKDGKIYRSHITGPIYVPIIVEAE